MEDIGQKHHLTLAQVAVVYCLSKGVIPVCGCRKPEQIDDLWQDTKVCFDESEIARLEAAADQSHVTILKSDIFRFAVKDPQKDKHCLRMIARTALLGLSTILLLRMLSEKTKYEEK